MNLFKDEEVEVVPKKKRERKKPTGMAPPDAQLRAMDVLPVWSCDSGAAARNAYGAAAQEIANRFLGLTNVPINGNYAVCFDAYKDGVWYEVKSTHAKAGKVVMYDWRMGKDAEAAQDKELVYVLVGHSIKKVREDILMAMLAKPVILWVLPWQVVHSVAMQCPLQKLKRSNRKTEWSVRNGYERDGYKDGYRNVNVKDIVAATSWVEQALVNPWGEGTVTLMRAIQC